ncbi:MAG: aminotransferase class V-fold PLP-dependent enzyme [Gammaproteobacteria bacterium]
MYETDFDLDDDVTYLNHAAVSPWPRRTAAAVRNFADENAQQGSRNYPGWLETEAQLREQLRQLINAASTDEIALLKNTSEALSVVAWGLPWESGDNAVISDQEFPSNRVVWESLDTLGVTTRQVNLLDDASPEAALINAMDERTRVLSVSAVQYGTGLRLDLPVLGAACRERGILFCVDAIQCLGAMRFDVQACLADFVMADGHKWMLGPEGVALFYCRNEVMGSLMLRQYGWHMLENYLDFDSHSRLVASSARRFECGSPNMLGIHALHASLGLLQDTGMQTIEQLVMENSRFMLDWLRSHADDFEIITPVEAHRHAGIVTFRPRREAPASLFDMLRAAGVACALRGGGVRLSPHYYTPRKKLFGALELLAG